MRGDVVLLGSGPSWREGIPDHCPVMAISSGLFAAHEAGIVPDFFCTLDRMRYYRGLDQQKGMMVHYPLGREDVAGRHDVRTWPVIETLHPSFRRDDRLDNCIGLDNCKNSLMFAIQLAMRLWFNRVIFCGVDLLEPEYTHLRDRLWWFQDEALENDMLWQVSSMTSSLYPAIELFRPVRRMRDRQIVEVNQ